MRIDNMQIVEKQRVDLEQSTRVNEAKMVKEWSTLRQKEEKKLKAQKDKKALELARVVEANKQQIVIKNEIKKHEIITAKESIEREVKEAEIQEKIKRQERLNWLNKVDEKHQKLEKIRAGYKEKVHDYPYQK